ncbi:MAG TPA: hypothetical protein VHD38_00075 [Candidatus Paceibacterota bacterium]|jgi:acyl dehydratase|nr:hypothetical protein [Candidatus Paceibacterota bacterium]
MAAVYFEDLHIGARFESQWSEPIRETTIVTYAAITGDRLHEALPGGLVLVQGNLAVALAAGLLFDVGHFTETLYTQARKDTHFRSPLYAGERIRAIETVLALEDRPGKPYGRVDLKREVMKDGGVVVHESYQEYRIRKRSA